MLADIFGKLADCNILSWPLARLDVVWGAGKLALSPGYNSREKWGCRRRLGVCKKVEEKVPEFKAAELQVWQPAAALWSNYLQPVALQRPLGTAGGTGVGAGRRQPFCSVVPTCVFLCKYPMIDGCGLLSYCINDDFILHFLKEVAK